MVLLLTLSPHEWRCKFLGRLSLLEKFHNLNVPQFIIDRERNLVEQAWQNLQIWELFEISAWEIDIVTGEMEITETNEEGRLILAMLDLEDDSTEEE